MAQLKPVSTSPPVPLMVAFSAALIMAVEARKVVADFPDRQQHGSRGTMVTSRREEDSDKIKRCGLSCSMSGNSHRGGSQARQEASTDPGHSPGIGNFFKKSSLGRLCRIFNCHIYIYMYDMHILPYPPANGCMPDTNTYNSLITFFLRVRANDCE